MFAAAIENPVARGAAKAYEASLSPEVTELHAECATRAVLAHVEGWTDDLAAECMGFAAVDIDHAVRIPGRLLDAESAVVFHVMMTATEPADFMAARDELTRRHLKANAERIKRLERMFAEGEL